MFCCFVKLFLKAITIIVLCANFFIARQFKFGVSICSAEIASFKFELLLVLIGKTNARVHVKGHLFQPRFYRS